MTETKMHSFLRHGVHLHVLIFEQIKMDGSWMDILTLLLLQLQV